MEKIKALLEKHKEIIMYLVFGVLTTFVGWAVYFGVMLVGRSVLEIPAEVTSGGEYFVLYTAAQVIQWVAAVLFAFFTNRKWVFTDADHAKGSAWKQLLRFAGSRVATFFMDLIVTYLLIHALHPFIDPDTAPYLLGIKLDAELWAKIISSVLVIIANYFLSKLFVFQKKST